MSHFAVLVITKNKPTQENLEEILQPWHEFECTGEDDEYIEEVDVTEESLKEYEKYGEGEDLATYFTDNGKPPIYGEQIPGEEHQYGYSHFSTEGALIKVIDRTNPNAKWDWWKMGGRWSGFFLPKSTAKDHEKGNPGVMESQIRENGFDSIRKGDIDFAAMIAEETKDAARIYDKVRSVIDPHLEGFVTWEKMKEKFRDIDKDIELARTAYHAQPLIKILNEASLIDKELVWIDVADFLCERDSYIRNKVREYTSVFAVIKDGEWIAHGEMGWFGCSYDKKADWLDIYENIINETPNDYWFTIVDCHI